VLGLCAVVGLATAADQSTRLEPLAFLAESCWAGTFPDGKSVDTHCFHWMYGGKFLRDVHVVRGDKPDYHGETVYWWDAREARPRYMYWNSEGGVSEGLVDVRATQLHFPEESVRTPDGKEQAYRSVWERKGADRYDAVTEFRKADGWQEAWRVSFKRTGPASAGTE
jgi:hypothetical protein